MFPPCVPPGESAEHAVARLLCQALSPQAMSGWNQQQVQQQQQQQTSFWLDSVVRKQDSTVMQQPGLKNMALPRPRQWLSAEKEETKPASNTWCQKPHSSGNVQVPGLGPVRKSDLVLLRAVHKGQLDENDKSAPDITMLTPQQLGHLEAFLDTSEDELWLLGLSQLCPPPGLEM